MYKFIFKLSQKKVRWIEYKSYTRLSITTRKFLKKKTKLQEK